jgi:D-glycero-D-manno-heptose 1,7-bisphosphate phosphatase
MANAPALAHPPFVGDDGVWCQQVRAVSGGLRPALFLDRDGVIVEEVHYLHRAEEMRLTTNAAVVIRAANTHGLPVIVVTNQSGVGRGNYGWSDFEAVQAAMLNALATENAFIDAVFACPFHGGGEAPWNIVDHPDRKPGPGMLLRAADMFPLDLAASWIVGDRAGDIGAGKNAGLAGGLHVLSGHGNDAGERAEALALSDTAFQVLTGDEVGAVLKAFPVFPKP